MRAVISAAKASANSTSQSAQIHISPEPAQIVSLLPNPLHLQEGATGTLTLTITPAQENPTTITLTNSNPGSAQIPATIIVPAGQMSTGILVTALISRPCKIDFSEPVEGESAVRALSMAEDRTRDVPLSSNSEATPPTHVARW